MFHCSYKFRKWIFGVDFPFLCITHQGFCKGNARLLKYIFAQWVMTANKSDGSGIKTLVSWSEGWSSSPSTTKLPLLDPGTRPLTSSTPGVLYHSPPFTQTSDFLTSWGVWRQEFHCTVCTSQYTATQLWDWSASEVPEDTFNRVKRLT